LIEREQFDDDSTERLAAAMSKLDARSQHILRTRWMTDDKATLQDLAEQYGVSAERVRQIETNAIKKLRAMIVEPEPA
jgi:RNA polymerase sigma-32 factor